MPEIISDKILTFQAIQSSCMTFAQNQEMSYKCHTVCNVMQAPQLSYVTAQLQCHTGATQAPQLSYVTAQLQCHTRPLLPPDFPM